MGLRLLLAFSGGSMAALFDKGRANAAASLT
jgi:hypothetical protein